MARKHNYLRLSRLAVTSAIILIFGWNCTSQEYVEPDLDDQGRSVLQDGAGYFMFVTQAVDIIIQD